MSEKWALKKCKCDGKDKKLTAGRRNSKSKWHYFLRGGKRWIKRQRAMKTQLWFGKPQILAKKAFPFTSLIQQRAWSWWSWGGRRCGFCAGTDSRAQTSWCSQWRWWRASEQHLKEEQRGGIKSHNKSICVRKFLPQTSVEFRNHCVCILYILTKALYFCI